LGDEFMIDTPRFPVSGFADKNNTWPVFRSLSAYHLGFLTHDLVAGLTLAAIASPEQMATARLGGGFPLRSDFSHFWRVRWHLPSSEATASCPAAPIQP
jgi:hypothetical protein